MSVGEKVNLVPGVIPDLYHCRCDYCKKAIGELRPADGTYYSRLERRQYYSKDEQGGEGHVAKTPLHVARWAIQAYSKKGDWVLDPTIGAGTTAVEAITQQRSVAGMELQFGKILQSNIKAAMAIGRQGPTPVNALVQVGDARNIAAFLEEIDKKFSLVVNNPPYSGDEHYSSIAPDKGKHQSGTFKYQSDLPNLAFLKEGPPYWEALRMIYSDCIERLVPGGHFVVGVKDMMRNKKPLMLHHDIALVLSGLKMDFVGTTFLKHWPPTQHLSTYGKRYGVEPPLYQTITVFQKPKKGARK
jgi:DNA modification methylase